MTDDPTPTTLRRQLGAQLRELRQAEGKTADEVAKALRVSISKVSRIETGARAASEQDIAAFIVLYGMTPSDAERVKVLARAARRRASLGPPPPTRETIYVKIEQSDFIELERDALIVREFNSGHVPGLLQTASYMRSSMLGTAPDVASDVVEKAIQGRLKRQQKFNTGFRYEVLIDEAALRRAVGGRDVMAAQAGHILSMIELDLVDFRVIPFDVGAYPGVNSQFVALTLPRDEVPDVVFAEGLFGQAKFNSRADVDRFTAVWAELSSLSESPEETRRRLRALAAAGEDRVEW